MKIQIINLVSFINKMYPINKFNYKKLVKFNEEGGTQNKNPGIMK
jgi:hypothetical protein